MHSNGLRICGLLLMASFCGFAGCAAYRPLTRPVPKLSVLSPELSERNIEKLLKAEVKPQFPAVLAVAKVTSPFADDVYAGQDEDKYALEFPHNDEMAGWDSTKSLRGVNYKTIISRVKVINPSLLSGNPTLRKLRDAAALLNAPLLLVYVQKDNASDGFNFLPGYTVGYYSVCQAVLVDTRSGVILATATSESKREEKVTLFGLESTKQKLQKQTQSEAVASLQKNFAKALVELEK
jgi:hypothetical protein